MSIDRVLVVGAGAMGSQIAMVAALAGCDVTLHDPDAGALDRAVSQLPRRMDDDGNRTRTADLASLKGPH